MTLLKWCDDCYRANYPKAEDVILLVEVARSSLKYDRGVKLALYAEAGIAEYWVVNLIESVIEVYTNPGEGKYQSVGKSGRGETLQLPGGLEGIIRVNDVLGEELNS